MSALKLSPFHENIKEIIRSLMEKDRDQVIGTLNSEQIQTMVVAMMDMVNAYSKVSIPQHSYRPLTAPTAVAHPIVKVSTPPPLPRKSVTGPMHLGAGEVAEVEGADDVIIMIEAPQPPMSSVR